MDITQLVKKLAATPTALCRVTSFEQGKVAAGVRVDLFRTKRIIRDRIRKLVEAIVRKRLKSTEYDLIEPE